jgi:hypothetical protein
MLKYSISDVKSVTELVPFSTQWKPTGANEEGLYCLYLPFSAGVN